MLEQPLEPSDAPFLRKPFSFSDLADALAGAVRMPRPYPR